MFVYYSKTFVFIYIEKMEQIQLAYGLPKRLASALDQLIGLVRSVFANVSGVLDSILGRVIPKTLKMVLDNSLLNTQQYKVRIQAKVEQSRERSSALPYTLV